LSVLLCTYYSTDSHQFWCLFEKTSLDSETRPPGGPVEHDLSGPQGAGGVDLKVKAFVESKAGL